MESLTRNYAVSLPPLTKARAFAIAAAFVVCYLLLAWIARHYLIRPFAITAWNPNAGFSLALLLVFGLRFWPAIFVASCLASLLARGIPAPPFFQLLGPVAIAAGYVGMAALLRGPLGFRIEFNRLRDVSMLVAVAAIGTLLIAIAFVSVFRINDAMSAPVFGRLVLRFWIGHLIGIVINTPLLLLLLADRQRITRALRQQSKYELVTQLCAVILTLWVIFGPRWLDSYKLFYLLFLPLIWIVMRHAIVGAILGTAVIQVGLIIAIVYADYQGSTSVTEFQFMMLALAVTGLFLGIVVTESRTTRGALNESESRLSAIVSTARDSIITVNRSGVIVAANPAASRTFGYAEGGLVGTSVHEVLPDFERCARLDEVSEAQGIRSDGSRFPVELSVGVTGEGPELRIAITRDITRRKTIERELAEKQAELGRSLRLAAAGEMAAALAHELHQPLSAIRNYARASQMQQRTEGSDGLPHKIEHEAKRAGEVVKRLRDFFRDGTSRLERISVAELIEGALEPMRERALKQHIELETDVACGETQLLIDRIQAETVIHNLVGNAMEAITGARSTVRRIQVAARMPDTEWVRLSILDSGPGVSPDIANRLFEPFATTKATGTGLGLAMSRSIIESQGGELWAEPDPTGGTVFCFTLPSAI
ncbi:MAG TPA: ATP-binding protein [Burkholderiales bacterium]|jgi:PAS domain S-box-containing protein|nr:ATP-binding protein [Burkholderiales bacterium]